jgi:threonine/homoserine/homoserine lactone efflux protein
VPSLPTYLGFVAALLAMQLVPRPETMLVISRGIGQGRTVAFWTVLGMTVVAGAIQLPLLALGIVSLVHSSPLAFSLLRWGGAVYLIWLGLGMLASRPWRAPEMPTAVQGSTSAVVAMRQGLIANLTNPNPIVFMLAFLPQFVDPAHGSITAQLLVLGAIQKITGLAVLGSTAITSAAVGGWLARRPGWLVWQERFGGAVIIGLGIHLVLTGSRTR